MEARPFASTPHRPSARDHGSRPLRIVHLLRGPVGGLIRHVVDLAREQARRGHEIGLICAENGTAAHVEAMLSTLAPACALGIRRLRMSRQLGLHDLKVLWQIQTQLVAMDPDVIHAHGAKGGVYARLPAFINVCPRAIRVYTPHGGSLHFGPGEPGHRFYMGIERLLNHRTDAFTFESQYAADMFVRMVGQPKHLSRVVRNGLYPAEFEPVVHAAETPADFLYLGEMRWQKGVDTLLEASALIRDRVGAEPGLALVGSGPHKAELKAHADKLGLKRASFMDPRPAREAFSLAPTMVLPSRAESLPYVILEAAAARMDLIATRVGGIAEILGRHNDRLIPHSDPEALARAMQASLAMTAAEKRARADEIASGLSTTMSVSAMADGILDTYRTALASRKAEVGRPNLNEAYP
jgi:glycosyltransferase involved in cell wall biosynthesis